MSVLQPWPNLRQQQDAGEFLTFLLRCANPPTYAGVWQARRSEHDRTQVLDGGTLSAPLAVPMYGQALQDCIDAWESQPSIHAAVCSGGLILVQLMRYRSAAQGAAKDERSIFIQPGQVIGFPHFVSYQGHQTQMVGHKVLFVICHLGTSLNSGHYITALSVPGNLLGRSAEWKWMLCDDGREPKLASARDLETIAQNAYIVGLARS